MSPSNKLMSPLLGKTSSFKLKERANDDEISSSQDGQFQVIKNDF